MCSKLHFFLKILKHLRLALQKECKIPDRRHMAIASEGQFSKQRTQVLTE